MSKVANLYISQNEDFEVQVELETVSMDVVNIENYELYGQVRKTYVSSTAIDIDITVIDAATANFAIKLDSDKTGSMKPGRYVYDIFAYNPSSGNQYKLMEGQVEIAPSVTKIED
jgi:hypothetical protein